MFRLAKPRYKGEWERPSSTEELERFKGKPGVFMHLSKLGPNMKGGLGDRLGINPNQSWKTPFGIYAYPFDSHHFKDLIRGGLPYLSRAPWVHLFQVRMSKCLVVSKYQRSDYERDLAKLKKLVLTTDLWDSFVQFSESKAKNARPATLLWNLTRNMASDQLLKTSVKGSREIIRWNWILRYLGYESVWDDSCAGLIHENEPCQIVVLSTTFLKRLLIVPNPHLFEDKEWGFYTSELDTSFLKSRGWSFGVDGWWKIVEVPTLRSINRFYITETMQVFYSSNGYLHRISPSGVLVSKPISHKSVKTALRAMRKAIPNLIDKFGVPVFPWFDRTEDIINVGIGMFEVERSDDKCALFFRSYMRADYGNEYYMNEKGVLKPQGRWREDYPFTIEEAMTLAKAFWDKTVAELKVKALKDLS